MAGCSIVFLSLIVLPLLLAALVIFFGILGGAVLTLVLAVTVFVVLTKKGIFLKYESSEVTWQRLLSIIGKALLIIIMIASVVTTLIGTYILYIVGK